MDKNLTVSIENTNIKKARKKPENIDKKIIFSVYFFFAVLYAVYCIWPLFWAFYNSLKSVGEYYESTVAFPKVWDFGYYLAIFNRFEIGSHGFWEMTFNSIWMAFGRQILETLASMLVAYPLARYKFIGKNFFYGIIVFRITIPIIGGGGAAYRLLRALNMINNPLNYSLTWFVGFDMHALIMYGYFKNISKEYSEAAFIDGATKFRTLFEVVFPQAWPCVLALYGSSVMNTWNDYSTAMLYLPKYPNLSYGIYLFQNEVLFIEGGTPMFYGAIILSSIVPLVLFAGGQKTMLSNMSVGGLKG